MNSLESYKLFEDESIDFLFIDGDHKYETVKKELKFWYPKIKNGGTIGGHDFFAEGNQVKKAVEEFFIFTGIKRDPFDPIDFGSSWWREK